MSVASMMLADAKATGPTHAVHVAGSTMGRKRLWHMVNKRNADTVEALAEADLGYLENVTESVGRSHTVYSMHRDDLESAGLLERSRSKSRRTRTQVADSCSAHTISR